MTSLFNIEVRAHLPRHRQVYEAVRTAILNGRLGPGERLPSSRALARHLSLSRATVTEAYDQLQAEGYLRGLPGSGTYVAPNLSMTALPQSVAPSRETVRLSSWGNRLLAPDVIEEDKVFALDLRPHRVALDGFPWADWRTAVDAALEPSTLTDDPSPAGHPLLREAVAEHVRRYRSVQCTADQVVIVNGARQGFTILSHLLLDSGDAVAVEDPGYPAVRLGLEAQGMRICPVAVDEEGMVIDALPQHPVRLVHVTPSHQDPTGITMSLSRRLALLRVAEHTGCIILEDDYDSEFRYEGRPVESLQGLDRRGQVVYAGTFSKSVLASLRIGFVVLPPALVQPFIAAKSLWDGGAPVLEGGALAHFMLSGAYERHIRRMRRLYRERRDTLVDALHQQLGQDVTVGERHGGLNVLVMCRTNRTDVDIVQRAANLGLGIRSARPYYSRPTRWPTFLLGFGGIRREHAPEAVKLLAAALGD